MKSLDNAMLDALVEQARLSPRLRTNFNLHEQLTDSIQRLAIAMEPETLVLPHRHDYTFEVLIALRGRFVVLILDEAGRKVVQRSVLGEGCGVVEIPANEWHAVLSLDSGGIIFEVKHGPYTPGVVPEVPDWARQHGAAELNAWYAQAQTGDSFSV